MHRTLHFMQSSMIRRMQRARKFPTRIRPQSAGGRCGRPHGLRRERMGLLRSRAMEKLAQGVANITPLTLVPPIKSSMYTFHHSGSGVSDITVRTMKKLVRMHASLRLLTHDATPPFPLKMSRTSRGSLPFQCGLAF